MARTLEHGRSDRTGIRIHYRIRGQRGRWEEGWGDELADGSVESAANLMMAIVYTHLMDLAGPPPEQTGPRSDRPPSSLRPDPVGARFRLSNRRAA